MFAPRPSFLVKVGACLATIVVTAAPGVLMAAPPAESFAVAAVFPPWWDAGRIRSAVEPVGAVATAGRLPSVVTVYGGPRLGRDLRAAGAWLILDPRLVGCGPGMEAAS